MELLIGVLPINEAKRIALELEKENVFLEIRVNEQTCQRGCQVTVELWGSENDKDLIVSFLQKENRRDLAGHDINLEQINQVYDPNAEEIMCQACGFKFSPKESSCPDCGLAYR